VRSGVPAEKVRIVPLGLSHEVFCPTGPSYILPTTKKVRFLFVGGALERKGADLLLEAYLRAFSRADDVCLVIKDMGTSTFYYGQTLRDTIRQVMGDSRAPEVVYLEDDMTDRELAALYRSCTCTAHPYRAEGFTLAPLEGMACGLPTIVTSGGPTDDYVDDMTALRVPHHLTIKRGYYHGPTAARVDPWELCPDLDALVDALRWVYERQDEAAARGRAASEVARRWTWQRTTGIARERLLSLVVGSGRAPGASAVAPPAAKPWANPQTASTENDAEQAVAASTEPTARRTGRSRRMRAKAPRTSASGISLCMIARDEEERIGNALESAVPHVDEIVVVDTGSRDRTRQIAASYGARVFDFPWTDSFAEARNQSIDQATGKWILWMDADDVMSAECGAQLRDLVRTQETDVAFQMQVHIPPGPNEFSGSVVDHVKLFPNRPDVRFEFRVHEQVIPSLRRANVPVRFTPLFVTHAHYDRSPSGQARKRQRDFRLLHLDLVDKPNHPFVLFNLGMTHLYATREHLVAAQYLRRCIDLSDWRDSIVRKAFALLATAQLGLSQVRAAIQSIEEGRRYYADDAELLFLAGQAYQRVGDFNGARNALEQLVGASDSADAPHYRSVDTSLRTFRGLHELAQLYRRLGDAPHCIQVLERVVGQYPHYAPARLELEETRLSEARKATSAAGPHGIHVTRYAARS
jgi:glycosyltransferase involved in cell wall biosynthesis